MEERMKCCVALCLELLCSSKGGESYEINLQHCDEIMLTWSDNVEGN
jgi:hypothetical protein